MKDAPQVSLHGDLLITLRERVKELFRIFFVCRPDGVNLVDCENFTADQFPQGRLDGIHLFIYLAHNEAALNVVIDETDYTINWHFDGNCVAAHNTLALRDGVAEIIFTQFNFRGRALEEIAVEIGKEIDDGMAEEVDDDQSMHFADVILDIFDIDTEIEYDEQSAPTKH